MIPPVPTLRAGLAGTSPLPRAGTALMGLLAAAALAWPVDGTIPPAAAPVARPVAEGPGAALARPLFDPLRRAWTARGSRADLAVAAPTALRVRGILVEARARLALIDDGGPEPAWLGAGAGRGAWRVVGIEPGQVRISDGGRLYTLDFLGEPVPLRPPPRRQAAASAATEPLAGASAPLGLRPSLPAADAPLRRIAIAP
jgi:hypothetical protein